MDDLLFPKIEYLHHFYVHDILHLLTSLVASDNKLQTLVGSGIERLQELQHLDLSNNLFSKLDELYPIKYLLSLVSLRISGNPLPTPTLRRWAINALRWARGSLSAPGIALIDEKEVTTDERVDAFSLNPFSTPELCENYRFRLILQCEFGQSFLRDEKKFTSLTQLCLSNKKLVFADLSSFRGLIDLNLSGNNLKYIQGLELLESLQRIDLSGNPSLPLDDVLTSLSSLHRLVDVALMVNTQLNKKVKMADSEKAAKSDGVLTQNVKEIETDSGKTDVKQLDLEKGVSLESMIVNNGQIKSKRNYREDALFMLLKNNNRLLMFDYSPITIDERLRAYRRQGVITESGVSQYRFRLCVAFQTLQTSSLRLDPAGVALGKKSVESLKVICLCGCGLISTACNFGNFVALEELNISRNALTTLKYMGLEKCLKMRKLDASFNSINDDAVYISSLLKLYASLEAFAINNNSYADDKKFKAEVLKKMDRKANPKETFTFFNEVLEPGELCYDGFQKQKSLSYMNVRYSQALPGTPKAKAQTKTLDLSSSRLKYFVLKDFANLKYLILNTNKIEKMSQIIDASCHHIEFLDLSNNRIKDFQEVLEFIKPFKTLRWANFAGNPFLSQQKLSSPLAITKKLLPLLLREDSRLLRWNGISLSATLIADAMKDLCKVDHLLIQSAAIIYRRALDGVMFSKLIRLNLSNMEITKISFAGFGSKLVMIEHLSLAKNKLNDKALQNSGLFYLTSLKDLDISWNKLKSKTTLANLLKKSPLIKDINVLGNEYYLTEQIDNLEGVVQKIPLNSALLHEEGRINGELIPTEMLSKRQRKARDYELKPYAFTKEETTRKEKEENVIDQMITSLLQ